jgi:hypothetical protein
LKLALCSNFGTLFLIHIILLADDEERELQMDPADYGKQRFSDVL